MWPLVVMLLGVIVAACVLVILVLRQEDTGQDPKNLSPRELLKFFEFPVEAIFSAKRRSPATISLLNLAQQLYAGIEADELASQ